MIDTCPHCVHRGNLPLATVAADDHTVRAVYRCARCRRSWTTDWQVGPAEACWDDDWEPRTAFG